jgi:uncharacterized protein YjbJ (UPF0337 family)
VPDVGGKFDEAKGRVKEAAGALADDSDLKAEGKTDRAAGALKDKLADATAAAEGAIDKIKDKLQRDK